MPHERNQKGYEQAALLVAQGELTLAKIAKRVSISREMLFLWRKQSPFKLLVCDHRNEILDATRYTGIRQKHIRLKRLQDRARRLDQVVTERGNSAEMREVPGGSTGFIIKKIRRVGGESAETFAEYSVDVAMVKLLNQIDRQAAIEAEQWIDRQQADTDIMVAADEVSPESLQNVIDILNLSRQVPELQPAESTFNRSTSRTAS